MKSLILSIGITITALAATAQMDLPGEGGNIRATVSEEVGITSITINYSRPGVKGREGKIWGNFFYREEDDVLRVHVKPVFLDKSVERLKYEFIEHEENSGVIAMQWEKLSVPFRVEVDLYNIILARLREQVIGVKGFLSANLIHGSMYCFDKGINMEEALGWAKRAVYARPFGQTGYSAYQNLATGYEKLNRLAEADSVMDDGLAIANVNEYTACGQASADWAKNLISANIEKLKAGKDINE